MAKIRTSPYPPSGLDSDYANRHITGSCRVLRTHSSGYIDRSRQFSSKSRIRKKDDFTPPPPKKTTIKLDSRSWVAPFMSLLFGLLWIVVFYVTDMRFPIESLKNWNIVVGFGFIAAGFGVSTQWK